jgi:hemin uptake protein HemP
LIDRPGESAGAREGSAGDLAAGVRIASAELFRGQREIVIVHRGQEYRLHITKADKLILTK